MNEGIRTAAWRVAGTLVLLGLVFAFLHYSGAWDRLMTALPYWTEQSDKVEQVDEAFEDLAELGRSLPESDPFVIEVPAPQDADPAVPAAPTYTVDRASVAAVLDSLDTTAPKPSTDYSREKQFGSAWVTKIDGCDTRNRILQRDLTDITLGADGCTVLTGTLDDPYTGTTINFVRGQKTSSAVQIDHSIPLKYAWVNGASTWTQDKRVQFANDPMNLLAVDGPENGSKSDRGPSAYMPPNDSYSCEYVLRFVAVADTYDLAVPQVDKDRITLALATCP